MTTSRITSGYVPGALGRVVELHGLYYAQYWKFGVYFESLVAQEMAEFFRHFDTTQDGFWTATVDEKIIGSISICGQTREAQESRLRWFILDPGYHGQGIGKRLMQEAIDFCRTTRVKRVWLTTFAGLDAARHLYERWGFALIDEHEGDQWGTPVREQAFELLL